VGFNLIAIEAIQVPLDWLHWDSIQYNIEFSDAPINKTELSGIPFNILLTPLIVH